jgi:hypothetical protein
MKAIAMLLTLLALSLSVRAADKVELTEAEKKDGWKLLFDGVETSQWRSYKGKEFPAKGWVAENGALTHKAKAGGGDIVTVEEFDNFELSLEWKIAPGGNSGIIYRVTEEEGAPYMTGPEMQVLDDEKHPDGKNPKTSAGALYALIACSADKKLKPVGEWNEAKLLMKNNHVEHWLNGTKVVEYEWGSDDIKKLIAGSKFATMKKFMTNAKGHIDLQDHGDEVSYRNIKIRVLK